MSWRLRSGVLTATLEVDAIGAGVAAPDKVTEVSTTDLKRTEIHHVHLAVELSRITIFTITVTTTTIEDRRTDYAS